MSNVISVRKKVAFQSYSCVRRRSSGSMDLRLATGLRSKHQASSSGSSGSGRSKGPGFPHSRIADKYGMRPRTIIRRLLQEKRLRETPQKLVKWKPQPLSKYRKKAAKTRQRSHVQQINQAFENLRNVLPAAACCRSDASAAAKMTILRLAVRYIAALTHLLEEDDTQRMCHANDVDEDEEDDVCSHDNSEPRPSDSGHLESAEEDDDDDDEASEDTYVLALAKIFDENSDSSASDGGKDEAEYHSSSDDLLSREDLSDHDVEEQLEALADLGQLPEGGGGGGTDPPSLS